MDRFVLTAFCAEDLVGAVREHLVAVHVVRRPGTRLIRIDHKMLAMLARQDLVGGLDDRIGQLAVETSGLSVREGGGFLDADGGVNEGGKRAKIRNRKVLACALGLNAPERIGRHGKLAQGIPFDSCLIHSFSSHRSVGLEPRIAHCVHPR